MRLSLLAIMTAVVVCLTIPGWGQDTTSQDTTPPTPTPIKYSGSVNFQYQGRFQGSQSANDLSQNLYFNVDGLFDGKVSVSLAMKFEEELDGYDTYQQNSTYYSFEGISDTYSQRNNGSLYYLYTDIKDVFGPTDLRLGRQYIYQLNFVHFDGASFKWDDLGDFNLETFIGKPVDYYTSDGNLTYGGSLDWHPWRYGSFGMAFMNFSQDSYNDNYLGFNAKQYFGDYLSLDEHYTFLNSDPQDFQVDGTYTVPALGLNLNATYYRQISELLDYSDQFSAYYQAIGDYEPFNMVTLGAYKEIGDHLTLNAGYTHRGLNDSYYESEYNRQYNLYFGGVTFRNIAVKDLDFSVTLQRWETHAYITSTTAELNANPTAGGNTEPNEVTVYYNVPGDNFITFSAEMAYHWNKKNRIQIGTDFQKYKYNYDTNEEMVDVRTSYLKWRWQLSEDWQFYAKLQQEQETGDDPYYEVVTSLSYSF